MITQKEIFERYKFDIKLSKSLFKRKVTFYVKLQKDKIKKTLVILDPDDQILSNEIAKSLIGKPFEYLMIMEKINRII